jgi:8-oxo-dGTP pyrophosphatase MutT (NUDIX family)
MAKRDASHSDVILAAGGLVWRESPRGRQIAVVHRPKYDDWTLPKGKLDPGESWQDGAVREVAEETGFDVQLGDFAGGCTYLARRAPKVVLYWHMEVEGEPRFAPEDRGEVDGLEWLSVDEAKRRLSYTRERQVLTESVAVEARPRAKGRWLRGALPASWLRRVARLRAASAARKAAEATRR